MAEIPTICRADLWTDFHMIGTLVMKEFKCTKINSLYIISIEPPNHYSIY